MGLGVFALCMPILGLYPYALLDILFRDEKDLWFLSPIGLQIQGIVTYIHLYLVYPFYRKTEFVCLQHTVPQIIWISAYKTEPVAAGADATARVYEYVWFFCQIGYYVQKLDIFRCITFTRDRIGLICGVSDYFVSTVYSAVRLQPCRSYHLLCLPNVILQTVKTGYLLVHIPATHH